MRATPRLSLFDPEQIEAIHEATLRVLSDVGAKFGSAKARGLLKGAGAIVDEETEIVRIPPEAVEWAIEKSPKTFLLAGRDRQYDCLLDHTKTFVTLGGVAPGTLDFRTGQRRMSTIEDLAEVMVLSDALPEIDFLWQVIIPTDEKPSLQELRAVATMFANSGKHVQADVVNPDDVPYVMEMVALASPGGHFDPEHPIFSNLYCPVSPLVHEAGPLEAAMTLAEQRVPQTIFSLPLSGATSPPTLAGTMAQVNAEVLSGVVALQLASPGCPLIYVGNAAIMDMRSATYAQGGAETALLNTGLVEIGKRYGLPTFTIGFYTDDKTLSVHAGIDMMPMAMNSFLACPDVISGPGLLDSAMLLNLPKLVLDAEMRRVCDRMMRGVAVDEEHLLVDLISSVGPSGQYLKAKETRRFLRGGEHYNPRILTRSTYEKWEADPRTAVDRAAEQAEEILATHKPMPLPDPDALEAVIMRADQELVEA
jgi:trimethylamine--corrinoid protein Co-methyltransferase